MSSAVKVTRKSDLLFQKVFLRSKEMSVPENDYETLIDLHDFKFILAPQWCEKLVEKPEIVVLVTSAPKNFENRRTIRETWGNCSSQTLILFLVGNVELIEDQMKLEEEFQVT
jgi:hypothetical protein